MSWVYVFEAPHAVKIGVAFRDVELRRSSIERASGAPVKIVAKFTCHERDMLRIEKEAHTTLGAYRSYGEWFVCTPEAAVQAVQQAVKKINGDLPTTAQTTLTTRPGDVLLALQAIGGRGAPWKIAAQLYGKSWDRTDAHTVSRLLAIHAENGSVTSKDGEWVLNRRLTEDEANAARRRWNEKHNEASP